MDSGSPGETYSANCPRRTREALEASLQIRRELNDPLGIVASLNDLGELALEQGQPGSALAQFKEAYALAQDIGEQNRIADVLTNIGEAEFRLGRTEEAVRVLRQAEELCDDAGDKLHLAAAKRGLAKAYLDQGDLERARESIKRAVDLFGQVIASRTSRSGRRPVRGDPGSRAPRAR